MKLSFKKSLASLLATVMMLSSAASLAAVPGATSSYLGSTASAYTKTMTRSGNWTMIDRGADATAVPTAPAENLFTVGGKVYNMLDTDADGNYFIMTNFGIGATNIDAFYTGSERTYAAMRFNAESSESVGSRLQARMSTYIPSAEMQAEVLNYTWYDEHDPADNQNYTTCKLAYPSLTELNTYKDEINWSLIDASSYGYMPTRTVAYNSSTEQYYIIGVQHYTKPRYEIAMWDTHRKSGAPNAAAVFFLNKDFFKTVKVDVAAGVGANVLAEISKYTASELSGVYTTDELIGMGFDMGEDNSDQVPTAYRNAVAGLTSATVMKDKDGNDVTSAHAKYENLSNDYTFKVGGKEFVLLSDDETGDHFVTFKSAMYEDPIGKLWANKTLTNKEDYVFSVNNANSVAAKLNADSWINGNIPEAMRSQLKDKVWWTEHDVQAYENINAWKTTAKIALPSYTEIKANSDRYPFGKVVTGAREWIRTFNVTSAGAIQAVGLIDENSAIRASAVGHYGGFFRPVFYVDKDFFKNVKVDDIAALGSGIKAEIVADYEANDLAGVYTPTELAQLGFDLGEDNSDQVPEAYRSAIKGFSGGTVMLDKDGAQITSEHAKYGNLSADYTFKVGGKEFVLLSDDETGDHFVTFKTNMYEQHTGNLWTDKTSTDPKTYVFSTSNANSIASALNADSWINGNIPEAMRNQLKEKVWWTEHDVVAYEDINAWKTTAKIALPSYAEIKANSDRFPFGNIPTTAREWIRTFNVTSTGAIQAIGLIKEGNVVKSSSSGHYGGMIRPVFYVDKDFFKNVKVDDIAALGSGIKAEIVANYTTDDLTGIYTTSELAQLGFAVGEDNSDQVPEAYRNAIAGLTGATIMKDKDGSEITSTHESYGNLSADYTFKVGGKEFVLLSDDETGDRFVTFKTNMYEQFVGNLWADKTLTNKESYVFRVDNANSVAATLNSEKWINDNIPAAMGSQLKEKVWWTEHDVVAYEDINAWKTTAKIALPSYTEIKANSDRFPFGNIPTAAREWIRTFNVASDGIKAIGLINEANAVRASVSGHYGGHLRPVFYVDKDFFRNVKVDDVAALGSGIKADMLAKYTIEELLGLYSANELIAIGYDAQQVKVIADRTLVKGYPGEDSYKEAFSGSSTIGNLVPGAATPEENIFKVGDKKFIYLDADGEGNMFVMANAYYSTLNGLRAYPTSAETEEDKLYNAENENSIASTFNSQEVIDGVVPAALQGYLVDHNWYVETNKETPYYTKAKVALPSATEIVKYWNKIGGWSGLNMTNSHTRTPYYKNGEYASNITVWVDNTNATEPVLKFNKLDGDNVYSKHRPVFFVNKDYFLDTVVNAEDIGDNVKQFIRASFTKSELKGNGYDEATLVALGYAAEPSATDIKIDAAAYAEGQTLTASYTFVAGATNMPEVKENSLYQWYRSSDANTYTKIEGATGLTYVLTSEDVGKYVKFGVKPANLDGVATIEYFSNATTKIVEKADFLFEVVLKDGSGNVVESVNGETAFTATFTATNLTANAENKELIIAVYDESNVLRAVNLVTTSIAVGTDDYDVPVSGFTATAGWTAKAMVWDNLENLVPLFGRNY